MTPDALEADNIVRDLNFGSTFPEHQQRSHSKKQSKGVLEAEQDFGFCFVSIFENLARYNCCRFEWALQEKYDYLHRNGRRRLWFKTGNGDKYKQIYGSCLVYVSLSFEVQSAIDENRLIRGRPSLTNAYDRQQQPLAAEAGLEKAKQSLTEFGADDSSDDANKGRLSDDDSSDDNKKDGSEQPPMMVDDHPSAQDSEESGGQPR
jgi:hypothetical protein